MGPRARGPREFAAHPASGNYSVFYSLSLISDIYCQMHPYLRMGVYNNAGESAVVLSKIEAGSRIAARGKQKEQLDVFGIVCQFTSC